MSDDVFESIPRVLQRQIDAAFTQTYNDHFPSTSSGGGFLPPSPSGGGGFLPPSGGFLIDDDDDGPTHLPLRLVPHALQLLDLPPDDNEVPRRPRQRCQRLAEPECASKRRPAQRHRYRRAVGRPARTGARYALCSSRALRMTTSKARGAHPQAARLWGALPTRTTTWTCPRSPTSPPTTLPRMNSASCPPQSPSPSPAQRVKRTHPPRPHLPVAHDAVLSPLVTPTLPHQQRARRAPRSRPLRSFSPELTADDPALPTSRIRVAEIQRAAGVLREKIKAEEVRANVVEGSVN